MTHHTAHRPHQHGHPGPGHAHDHDHAAPSDAELAPLLDLDAEVLHEHYTELTDWLAGHTTQGPTVRRVLDLGAGTGTGTFGLLRRFPAATVTAVDSSPVLLARLAERAEQLGLADRVTTVVADLDAPWPTFDGEGGADLIWASASLHHLADPARALRRAYAALRPGGLLAVAELSGFPHFLPDDIGLGTPGLEDRCSAALAAQHAAGLPHLGDDWGPLLTGAGFELAAERHFAIHLTAPLPAATGRYALARLSRVRTGLADRLSAEDAATLDRLTATEGPASVLHRTDLTVRTERDAWLARCPAN
ncbi:methyltransferase type 12 [Kitasatospora sp. MMS16-BH015]|uniref:class I SAM-dependent methyltransferase n=1 Tax=Kitasatospora sp. MMS16-BH015 TaxID=2018025 RepID=UPI000CA34EE4|nr:class I SAM-dependent methyltransferase [Kitasatospora sp. MMS16-BH015]AUG75797.1 methyltransferase type 12 [Kitasatospora sp. MMS16-BH015]